MTDTPCPRCGMLLGPEEAVCPHCRTPRGDSRVEEGPELAREEELRAKRRPKAVAACLAALFLLAGAWLARARIGSAWTEFTAEVERTRQPGHWKKAPEPLPPPPPPETSKPEVAVSSFIDLNTNQASAPAPEEASGPVPNPAAPSPAVMTPLFVISSSTEILPPQSADEVRIHGTVYDLATKDPVRDVQIRFIHKQRGLQWEATTDAAGRYQVDAFKNFTEAVAVTIEAAGYRKGLLEDRDPPYRERTSQARADVIAETVDSDLEPVPLRYRPSAQIVQLDLVLVPLEKK